MLRGLGSKPTWFQMPLGEAGVGGWADTHNTAVCGHGGQLVTPGWDSSREGSCPGSWNCSSLWDLGQLVSGPQFPCLPPTRLL